MPWSVSSTDSSSSVQDDKGIALRPPNALPLSCAAPIDRNHSRVLPAFKKGTISRPHSGVSYSGGLGRTAAVPLGLVAPASSIAASLKEPSHEA